MPDRLSGDLESEPALHRVKIVVAMKQDVMVANAERRNDHADCFAHVDAAPPQAAIVGCTCERDVTPQHVPERQARKQRPRPAVLSVVFRWLCDASYHRRLMPYRAKMRSEVITGMPSVSACAMMSRSKGSE